jgi:hypothetical protein
MPLKNNLTNEKLNQRFDNPFALVNYAIHLAKIMVHRGESLDSNPTNDVLDLIAKGEDLPQTPEEADEEVEEEGDEA